MMLTIKKGQEKKFNDQSFKKFEDDTVEHVKKYFPNHFIAMEDITIRDTIRYGYSRAKKYDFFTQRNVCLYLNNMFVLGSNFDTDPQYPWANFILNDKNIKNPQNRIDKLSKKAEEVFREIAGLNQVFLNRTLINIKNNSVEVFRTLMTSEFKTKHEYLNILYSKKYEVIGEVNLITMAEDGFRKARKYGLTSEPALQIYIVFMFMLGHSFDIDPQFPWASKILNDRNISNEKEKMKILFDRAILALKSFFAQNNN